jgi:ribose-phosphate pyrophosphokinase
MGNSKRAADFARELGDLPFAAGNKTRFDDNTVAIQLIGNIAGHKAIVVDDEIATGSSIIETVTRLREMGITEVTVVCTHGVFTGDALKRLAAVSEIKEIVTTDTLPIDDRKKYPMLTVLSVAPLFGECIRRNAVGRSIGDLFIDWKDMVDLDDA